MTNATDVSFSSIYASALQTLYATTAFSTENSNSYGNVQSFSYAEAGSTYSFGLYQFDVGHTTVAQNFLLQNGFTQAQVNLLSQTGDPLSTSQINSLSSSLLYQTDILA